jgi:hypothetical protein
MAWAFALDGEWDILRGQSRAVTMRSETEYKPNLRPKPKTSSQTTHQRFRPGAHEHSSSCCRATLTIVRDVQMEIETSTPKERI